MDDNPREYLARMARERGYVLDFHRALAAEDFPFLKAYNAFVEAGYLAKRSLDERTKELIYIATLTAVGSPAGHIRAHMVEARRAGATKREVLETIELILPAIGVARFMPGFAVWQEVFEVKPLEAPPLDG